ncbi:MAG TPA: hypothetical protein VFD02_03005 [Syntrophomonadaceae bacterium]|nr:hypothetical protein [Syntrophomonadaceae bacterium]
MKIYQVCEVCNLVYNTMEAEGAEGAIEIKGICDDCALEIGTRSESMGTSSFWYN